MHKYGINIANKMASYPIMPFALSLLVNVDLAFWPESYVYLKSHSANGHNECGRVVCNMRD